MLDSYGDLMATPPMYRDIGSTFMAEQMPIPTMGMPYVGGGYGIAPIRRSLTQDKFESVHKYKEEQKNQIKKTVGIMGGVAAALIGIAVLRKKNPAVDKFLTKAVDGFKDIIKTAFKRTPKMKALPPHVNA